jgi:hypothetical protein
MNPQFRQPILLEGQSRDLCPISLLLVGVLEGKFGLAIMTNHTATVKSHSFFSTIAHTMAFLTTIDTAHNWSQARFFYN